MISLYLRLGPEDWGLNKVEDIDKIVNELFEYLESDEKYDLKINNSEDDIYTSFHENIDSSEVERIVKKYSLVVKKIYSRILAEKKIIDEKEKKEKQEKLLKKKEKDKKDKEKEEKE